MAITLSTLLDRHKRWGTPIATLNGHTYLVVDRLPNRSMGLDRPRGGCSVVVQPYPDEPAGSPAVVSLTINGETQVYFTGYIGDRPIADNPHGYEVQLVDSLYKLDTPLPNAITWNDTPFDTAAQQLLNAAGITDEEIHGIHNPGAVYDLGTNYPITLPKGTSIQQAISKLMTFGGTQLRIDPETGLLDVVDGPGWPATGDPRIYAFAPAPDEFGYISGKRTLPGFENVVRSYTAKGPKRPDLAIPDATFTLSGVVVGDVVEESFEWLQEDATAEAIAEREIVRRNRQAYQVELQAPLNPQLRPGDSIQFRATSLEVHDTEPALIISATNQDVTMSLVLSVGPEPAEGDLTIIPPPNASFSMQYETQPITLSGVLANGVVVQCTDTSSDPSGFTILSRSWAAVCAGEVSPATSNERDPIFSFSTLDGAQITLVVEASSGEGDIATQAVNPPAAETFTRELSVAAGGDGWRVLDVGGWRGWTGAGANCTAVPNINPGPGLLAGFADGTLYQTLDRLLTPPTLLATLASDPIGCIFVNEADSNNVLVACGAALYRSTNGFSLSSSLLHTFDDPIRYCESSPSNPNEIRVAAGESLWFSTDASSFTAAITVAGGSAQKVASAPWGHLVVFAGVSSLDDAWRFEESGYTIDWSGVPAENLPTDLSSATPWQYAEGYVVSSGGGDADLVRDGLFGQLTYLAAPSSPTQLYKLTQAAPGAFVAAFIGTATEGGAEKVVNHAGAYKIDEPNAAYRIGYGQAINPLLPPKTVLLPYDQDGAADVGYIYDPIEGISTFILPIANAKWGGVVFCPGDQAKWIIFERTPNTLATNGTGRVFLSVNSGGTWLEITDLQVSPWTGNGRDTRWAGFTGSGDEWFLSQSTQANALDGEGVLLMRGSGGSLSATFRQDPVPFTPDDPEITVNIIPVDGGLLLGAQFDQSLWRTISGVAITDRYITAGSPMDTMPSGGAVIGVQSTNIIYTPNYLSTAPEPVVAAGGSVVAMADGTLLVGNRTGVARITGFPAGPIVTIEAAPGVIVGRIVRGVGRRYAVVIGTDNKLYGWNGLQWASIDLPAGVTQWAEQPGVLEL